MSNAAIPDLSAALVPKLQAGGATPDLSGALVPKTAEAQGGWWNALKEDLTAALQGMPAAMSGPIGSSYIALRRAMDDYKSVKETGKTIAQRSYEARRAAGYGAAYSALSAPAAEAIGVNVSGMEKAAARGDTSGVVGHTIVPATMALAPLGMEGAAKLLPRPGTMGRALIEVPGAIGGKVYDLVNRLAAGRTPANIDTVPASGQFQAALRNTPREILNYAGAKGIDLTPGQATAKPVPRTIEALGERSLADTGLPAARETNALKLAKNVQRFADQMDPYNFGASDESAGETIRQNAQTAMEVRKENANQAYEQVKINQENLAGDVSGLSKWADSMRNVRHPGGAATRPVYQAPAAKAALDDIGGAPDRLPKNPDIQSMRNLRSEFIDKANDYSGNIPDSARALYKQAASKVDSYIMNAAEGTPFEENFRDASRQWKELQQLYNERGSPLARILQQKDSEAITRNLVSRQSAEDIETMKMEHMDPALEALRRRVVQNVANGAFAISAKGLAGYSDAFLKALFGEGGAKELYLNGELMRRMKFQVNTSGTSNVLLGMEQLPKINDTGWINTLLGTLGAAKASMPRAATSYLPKTVPLSAAARAGP